jgi:holo-[acyl-carrier protein] synthase
MPEHMILGTGIDLVEIQRIRDALARHGEAFARRILTQAEWDYCTQHADPAPCLASRFAAKEAVSKALGCGIGPTLGWHDIEIVRLPSGQPTVRMSAEGNRQVEALGGRRIHLSISHERGHAAAIAILEN